METVEKIIAKCGLICTDCLAYKATVKNDDELRKKTAEQWSAMFNADVDWKTINCLGCRQKEDGTLFSYCNICGIRTCAVDKGHETCADCSDFGCDKVAGIWKHNDQARKNLEALQG